MADAVRRCRPLLGTIVTIQVDGLDAARSAAAIDAAFAEIALVHRLMSYQEFGSDVGAANRGASADPVPLHELTRDCLSKAIGFARASGGAFDPTAITRGGEADRPGCWRDIDLDERGVRFGRPLAFDLSGIAKGFAVDRACDILAGAGVSHAVVNAGGDLRVIGDGEETVALKTAGPAAPATIMLAAGALASSDPAGSRAEYGADVHLDGRDRAPVADRFVAVTALSCTDADALTKIVLALGEGSAALLGRFGATAYVHDDRGWSTIAGAPA